MDSFESYAVVVFVANVMWSLSIYCKE